VTSDSERVDVQKIKLDLSLRVREELNRLRRTGLYGETAEQVAEELLRRAVRDELAAGHALHLEPRK
jgi:hypothetical protein